ncbi:MAG: ABC transporter permease, partial [Rubrobacter sp.]
MSTAGAPVEAATKPTRPRRLLRSAVAAGVLLGVLAVLALGADFIRPLDDTAVDLGSVLQPPSAAHPIGTDEVGRDLLARVLQGLRVSFIVATFAALVAVVVGGVLGLLAGTIGGFVDGLVMRFVDLFTSQNHLLLGLLLVVLFRPAFGPVGAVLL